MDARAPSSYILGVRLVRFSALSLVAWLSAGSVAAPLAADAEVHHGQRLADKKGATGAPEPDLPPLLSTLVQTHTDERVMLDERSPPLARFSDLLADRVTGARTELDPRLLDLLRALAARHPGARIELVSGFRSPKLNEMLRKKGHHVASHSQHSLGHACDFRVVLPDAERALAPAIVEREIRDLGWTGGVGIYPTRDDWFVHADVGPMRRWVN